MRAIPADRRRRRVGAADFRARVARLAFGLALSWFWVFSQAATVVVLTPRTGSVYDELVAAFQQEVARSTGLRVEVLAEAAADPSFSARVPGDTVMVVTVGVASTAQSAVADIRVPVLSVLVPRASYDSIAKSVPAARRQAAVYIDQPPERQLDLLRALLPSAHRIGLVAGPATEQETQTLRALAARRGLELIVERAGRESELYSALQMVMRSADAFIALPDPAIVNVSTAQNLLLTSYRFRIPVIGYSASYVRAGALAAVHSTPQQIGTEAGQIVRNFVRTGAFPSSKHPRYFSVSVNRAVADSLGLSVPEESVLMLRLQQAEKQE
jgi:putative ABC transport system substrate-binding protein